MGHCHPHHALGIAPLSVSPTTPLANCGKLISASLHASSKFPAPKNKRFVFPGRTSRNENVLEVVLGGKIYPGFLTLDDPEDQSRFYRMRNGLPTSFGQVEFMPIAFNPIEAYG
jgi:hypothetical protein